MKQSKVYKIPIFIFPAFREAARANCEPAEAPFIQTADMTEEGFSVIVNGFGEAFDMVVRLAEIAEHSRSSVILPPSNPNSLHKGTPGESYEFVGSVYHSGAWIHPEFGVQFIHRFKDKRGNELTWSTKVAVEHKTYKVTCRVKTHDVFQNIKQTRISHARLEEFSA